MRGPRVAKRHKTVRTGHELVPLILMAADIPVYHETIFSWQLEWMSRSQIFAFCRSVP